MYAAPARRGSGSRNEQHSDVPRSIAAEDPLLLKRDEKRARQLLSVAMEHGHPDAAKLLAQVDAPRTKAQVLAKLDGAIASDNDPELRKAAQWMKGMIESGRGKLVKSGGSGTGERGSAKKKRVNPKKKKGRAAKPRVITVDCSKL